MLCVHDGAAVKLVPEHAVIIVGGSLHHLPGKFPAGEDSLGLDMPPLNKTAAGHPVKMHQDQVGPRALGGMDKGFGGVGREPVVPVHKLKVFSLGLVHGLVPAVGDAGVWLVDETEPAVGALIRAADVRGGVVAAVVDQQDLKLPVSLSLDGVQALLQIGSYIIDGDDNGYQWFSHGGTSLFMIPCACLL